MADLPLILAGPILRRVEPTLVCVWVALSEPKAIRLQVFQGREQAGLEAGVYTGGAQRERMRAGANTVRVGANLHVGIVYTEFLPEQPLLPGLNYSYNLAFGAFIELDSGFTRSQGARFDGSSFAVTADLRSEKLLRKGPLDGRPHLPLGYDEGELPGFSLPPPSLTDLRILHGSCRRPGSRTRRRTARRPSTGSPGSTTCSLLAARHDDELPFDANVRPHQLFLTGDQIYADDVSTPLLPMLNRAQRRADGPGGDRADALPARRRRPGPGAVPRREAPEGFSTIAELVTQTRSQDRLEDRSSSRWTG